MEEDISKVLLANSQRIQSIKRSNEYKGPMKIK